MASTVPRDPTISPEMRRFLDDLARVANIFDGKTAAEATALLNVFTSTLNGLAPLSGGGTTNFLRADATWANPLATGSVLQCLQTTYTTNADLTTALPIDDTVPTITEGDQVLSLAITPTDATNKILCVVHLYGGAASLQMAMALFRGSTCINANTWGVVGAGGAEEGSMIHLDSPASASAQTYSVRVGTNSGGAMRLNGHNTSRLFGGVSACTLTLIEIAA